MNWQKRHVKFRFARLWSQAWLIFLNVLFLTVNSFIMYVNQVMDLEEQLKTVILQRKMAEKATADVLAILESEGMNVCFTSWSRMT